MKFLPPIIAIIATLGSTMFSCSGEKSESFPAKIVVDSRAKSAEAAASLADKLDIDLLQFSVPDSLVFSAAKSLIYPDDQGLIAETSNSEIFVFDRDMKMISRFMPKGQGPKEVSAILSVARDSDRVYIADFTKINEYDLDGNYIATIDSIDGERSEIEVRNGKLYLKHRFSADNELDILDMEGKPISRPFVTREVIRRFFIPSGSEDALVRYNGGIAFAPVLDNRIYSIEDTTVTTIAEFDFGNANIPESFFEGSVEKVEDEFHNRRNNQKGFVYFASLSLSDDWLAVMAIGLDRESQNILVDRRTGQAYMSEVYPDVAKRFFGKRSYIEGYLPFQNAFFIPRSADNVAEVIASLSSEQLDRYPALKAVDIESLDEDSNDFVILFRLK